MEAFDAVQSIQSIESNYGPQVAREVVQIFINDYPAKIENLKKAIENGETDKIRFYAHDIKSGCLSMGVKPMSSLCETIEHQVTELSQDRLKDLAQQISVDYQEISAEFGNYLNNTTTH